MAGTSPERAGSRRSFSETDTALWIYRLCRWALAAVFLYAGATKLAAPREFALLIGDYGLVPESWHLPIAVGLPVLEVTAAAGLLVDIRGSLAIIAGLLSLFMAILGYGIWMGLDVDCGCFGPNDPEAAVYHGLRPALYRDMALMAGIGWLYFWRAAFRVAPIGLRDWLQQQPHRRVGTQRSNRTDDRTGRRPRHAFDTN